MNELSNAQLARGLRVAPSIITRWSRKDPPIPRTSIEAALRWRRNYAPERGRRVKDLAQVEQEKPAPTTTTSTAPATDRSWAARLERAQTVELEIFNTLTKTLAGGDYVSVQRLQTAHIAAIKEIASAELTALEVQTAARDLIPIDDLKSVMADILAPLRQELERLPITHGHQANPEHPEIARAVLEKWVDRTLSVVRQNLDQHLSQPDADVSSNVALADSRQNADMRT
jgi:hypothetical protein